MIRINPKTLDAELVCGDTGTFSFALKINGNTFLKTGDKVYFTLKKKITEEILIEKEITEFPNGIVTIPIPPNDTRNMEPGSYIYSLKLMRADGNEDTLMPNSKSYATFSLKKGVK